MANLFEKPIAANPLSQFVELPLGFMDQLLERRQQQYDRAKAEMQSTEDSLLKLNYLPGDAERHQQIQAQYDQRLNDMIENAGGDYSRIQPQLDMFTRELKRDIAFGELGYQQRAYDSAAKFRETLDSNLSEGKYSQEGYNLGLQSIQAHRTMPNENGTFNTFTGYMPSTIVDPIKTIQDGVDEMNAWYDEQGQKYLDKDRIYMNILAKYGTNSSIQKALVEKGLTIDQVATAVINDKEYYEKLKNVNSSGGSNTLTPMVIKDVAIPLTGGMDYTAGSVPLLKDLGESFNLGSWDKAREQLNTPEMKNVIAHLKAYTNEEPPTEVGELSRWVIENSQFRKTGVLVTKAPTSAEQNIINSKGQFQNLRGTAIRDAQTGELLSEDDKEELMSSTKDATGIVKHPFVSGVVKVAKGYHPGDIVITSAVDNKIYIAESGDPRVIVGDEYNLDLIKSVGLSPTGSDVISLKGNAYGVPMGTYEITHNAFDDSFTLKQGGEPVYKVGTRGGQLKIYPLKDPENE